MIRCRFHYKGETVLARNHRISLIEEIEQLRGSRVITVVLGDRRGMATVIADDLLPLLQAHLTEQPKIDLFLYSTGGVTITGYALVNAIREFCGQFGVIVPFKALSCATLIALGANEIVMTRIAHLSPVDPSVNHPLAPQVQLAGRQQPTTVPVSVEEVNGFVNMARDAVGLASEESMARVFELLSSAVNPLTLGAVQRAREEIAFLAKELMKLHMTDETHIERVASILCKERFSHQYLIGRREAREVLGLNVLDPEPRLGAAIDALHQQYRDLLRLDEPYNPESYLDHDSETTVNLLRAAVETRERSHWFRTSKRIRRVETVTNGAPQIGYLDLTLAEGWVSDETV